MPDIISEGPSDLVTVTAVRVLCALVGFVAGGVAFAGFFVDFFANQGGSASVTNLGSAWFDVIPALIGVSALVLVAQRLSPLFAGLSISFAGVALGMSLALRGVFTTPEAATHFTYGPGFWMLTIGTAVLIFAWVAVLSVLQWNALRVQRLADTPVDDDYGQISAPLSEPS